MNPQFDQYVGQVSVDGTLKGNSQGQYPIDSDKHDWYYTPLDRSLYPEFQAGQKQKADIRQCDFSYFFFHPLSNAVYLVTEKKSQYYGYESEIFCSHPSQNNSIWTGRNSAGSKCRTAPNNKSLSWFSPTCRGCSLTDVVKDYRLDNSYEDTRIDLAYFKIGQMQIFLKRFADKIFNPMDELYHKIQLMISKHEEAELEMKRIQEEDQQLNPALIHQKQINSQQASGNVLFRIFMFNQVNIEYKKTQLELNELFDAANLFIKTLRVAKQALVSGDHNKALLNYNEIAMSLGHESSKKGICYNNIGCIRLSLKDKKPKIYFNQALIMQLQKVEAMTDKDNADYITQKFILACRYYNTSVAYQRSFKERYKVIISNEENQGLEKLQSLRMGIEQSLMECQEHFKYAAFEGKFLDFITFTMIQKLEFLCYQTDKQIFRSKVDESRTFEILFQEIKANMKILQQQQQSLFQTDLKQKENERMGLKVIEYSYLNQYFIFTLGLYFELFQANIEKACELYSYCLKVGYKCDSNITKQCLKRIIKIKEQAKSMSKIGDPKQQLRLQLSKYYISNKSVMIIMNLQKSGEHLSVQKQIFEFFSKLKQCIGVSNKIAEPNLINSLQKVLQGTNKMDNCVCEQQYK
ncbi:UNKNOWN [Stylonychia lemnae]|uniref:Uncharacterized protein n=1 Tax=Stylonychia lemnae TaxID=5949 RepID=A0A078ANH7_STYLE|nr:UNKNOWN [Stylonychia lemnae]|eukprot:CDW83476.1 UNKNOWN [Stylonychia lemnae]